MDVIGDGHCGFRAIAEFMGLTEESHIMIRHNMIVHVTYFEHLGENQYTRHLFGQMPCIDLGEDRDEYTWKTASYMH